MHISKPFSSGFGMALEKKTIRLFKQLREKENMLAFYSIAVEHVFEDVVHQHQLFGFG